MAVTKLGVVWLDAQRLGEVLVEFAQTLVRDPPIQRILDRLVQRSLEVIPVTGAGVLLMDPHLDLRFVAASDDILLRVEGLQQEFGEGPCITAYQTGKQVLIPDLGTDQQFPKFSPAAYAGGLGAVFAFPMAVEGRRLGAMDVYRRDPGPLAVEDTAACQVLADVATSYVYSARVHAGERQAVERFRELSLHDSLTGLPNRVLLHDRLSQVVAKAQRSGSAAAILFVDLDRFKTINDSHGHLAGDQVLIAVSERLRHAVRPSDTLARLSGDEFVIVCDELDEPSQAETVALRVANVLAEPIAVGESLVIDLTASVGIAYAGPGTDVPEALLRDADAAMFSAKQRGGGRYVVHDHEVGSRR